MRKRSSRGCIILDETEIVTCKLIDYIIKEHPLEWEEYKEEYIDLVIGESNCGCNKTYLLTLKSNQG